MTSRRTTFLSLALLVVGACAVKEDAEPAEIALDVQFPSPAAGRGRAGGKVLV